AQRGEPGGVRQRRGAVSTFRVVGREPDRAAREAGDDAAQARRAPGRRAGTAPGERVEASAAIPDVARRGGAGAVAGQDRRSRLLVGAQSGVMSIDPVRPADVKRYADRDITSPLGFNSVATTGGGEMIWATHGEAGLVAWHVDEPGKPALVIRPQNAGEPPRNVVALDDERALYSAGGAVFMADASQTFSSIGSGAGATVLFIGIEANQIIIARGDGSVDHLDRATLERIGSTRHCGETTAAGSLPWLGTTRLLLATADGPVCCVGTDDP